MSNEFGKFIKEKRTGKALSMRIFANLTKESVAYISSIENGRRTAPSETVLERFADVLCLSNEDRFYMFDLAAKSKAKPTLATDLVTYINENKHIRDVLRLSKELNVESSDWENFMKVIECKYLK